MSDRCFVCGKELPNRWAVARRETVDGAERCWCALHAAGTDFKKPPKGNEKMENAKEPATEAKEREIAQSASRDSAKSAWSECAALAAKLGGGVKALWSKLHPDRSPAAMLAALNENQGANKKRIEEVKPSIEETYRRIAALKKEYTGAPPARQRLLKIELQTLMARYKGLEREFAILCENERSIETVKGRYLEVLAHGLRGRLDADMVEDLADDIETRADEAEDIQDALGTLDKAGRRREREDSGFEDELAMFDDSPSLFETTAPELPAAETPSPAPERPTVEE